MDDEETGHGVTQDPRLSRRVFGMSAAAMLGATAAHAAAAVAEREPVHRGDPLGIVAYAVGLGAGGGSLSP